MCSVGEVCFSSLVRSLLICKEKQPNNMTSKGFRVLKFCPYFKLGCLFLLLLSFKNSVYFRGLTLIKYMICR